MNREDTPKVVGYGGFLGFTQWDLFYEDKDYWYEEKDGKKDWSKGGGKEKLFWRDVREKMAKKDLDFSNFIFPEFLKGSFWEEGEEYVFSNDVNFNNAQFSGDANFKYTQFFGVANFVDAQFSGEAYFKEAQFVEDTNFDEVEFSKNADFVGSEFSKDANFLGAKFSKDAIFDDVKFLVEADFRVAEFSGGAHFFECTFFEADFGSVKFLEDVNFTSSKFKSAEFESASFSQEKRTLFQEWEIEDNVTFKDVIFPDTVQFQRCNMKKVEFQSCDFVKVNFSNCKFHIRKNRLVLLNDLDTNYGDVSNMYRQLKRNRMDAKDWADAGDAYRSEMVMKRKQVREEIRGGHRSKWANWWVMGLYDLLSGYQQSIGRPLGALLGLFVAVPIVLVAIDPCHDVFNGFETSFTAALPIAGKLDCEGYPDWCFFVLLFERVFSITLLTFFGLATRARLRQ